ncbi:MAG TPA: nucleotidyltransferase [Solirubrobacteraceae bacterium]|nr:nucleotidyltransferase [Solirubrobacteraceae bacterium]
MDLNAAEFKQIIESLRTAAAALRDTDVRYCLSGSVASWARGGPETVNDVDLIVAPDDVAEAVKALEATGMRSEVPPEGWLVKLWDGEVLVDVIHTVTGYESVDEILERSETMRVASLDVPVAQMEDVLTPKLLAFDEHYLDYTGALRAARALREQIDWQVLREKTCHSPYAQGFFGLLEALDIIQATPSG